MIKTGLKKLDQFLGGGIKEGLITSIFGQSATGKTQLAFQVCLNAFDDDKEILFHDTTGEFRPERLVEMMGHQKINPSLLSKIQINRVTNTVEQLQALSKTSFENYSLLKKDETDIQKTSVPTTAQELKKINSLDISDEEMRVEEEPGFPETGQVNPQDLEDSEDLPDPETRALRVAATRSEGTQGPGIAAEEVKNSFSDPDLNPPDDPFILIRHPGVKKIYNHGMTAIIQKNHDQAILVFENFTERFPDDLDSDNAFYWIGRSYLELNEFKKAEEAFRKVLRLYEHRPTSQGYKTPDALYMLGKLQALQNLDQRAVYYYEEVIKRFPGSAAARNAERDLGR